MKKIKFCPVCGRKHNQNTETCAKHYHQFKTFGKYLDSNPRNQYDANEIRIKNGIGEIDTYDINCNVAHTFKFDLEDLPLLIGKKWRSIIKRGVPYLGTGHTIYFHKLICKTDLSVDHINRDTTDNRKENLREASNSLQQINQNVQANNTTNVTGIYFHKKHNTWHAELTYQKKRYFGPMVKSKEEAVFERMLLEQKFLGETLRPFNEYTKYIETIPQEKKRIFTEIYRK